MTLPDLYYLLSKLLTVPNWYQSPIAMALRKKYEREEYLEKTAQLEKLVYNTKKLDLTDPTYQISGACAEPVHYVDRGEMATFEPLKDFDCRLIKLINYGRPAISLHYFSKHKYYLKRNLDLDLIEGLLAERIEQLKESIEGAREDEGYRKELEKELRYFRKVYKQADKLPFALSNYSRYYHYTYVSYRYQTDRGLESANSHLINHTLDKETGEILIERLNVIFVDEAALQEHHPYDNSKVLTYLKGFSRVISLGKTDFYVP